MASNSPSTISPTTISNRLVRIAGHDEPAGRVLAKAVQDGAAPVSLRAESNDTGPSDNDYALIDPMLAVDPVGDELANVQLAPGTGYAGMTPAQRAAYLRWLEAPNRSGPRAFQDLYLAQIEVRLFEGGSMAEDTHLVLHAMQSQPAWQGVNGVARAILLAYWLNQDGAGMRTWLSGAPISPDLLALGLGMQAVLETPLDAAELAKIGELWQLPALLAEESVLKVRLASLTTTLGGDPLAMVLMEVLAEVDETAMQPRPWRANHRELRLALPQPRLRRPLEQRLSDLEAIGVETIGMETIPAEDIIAGAITGENTSVSGVEAHETKEPDEGVETPAGDADGTIILEFGESRSEYFDYVQHLAQRLDGYSQLMDEDRRLIYRVRFRKSRLRNFWRIWEFVQNWSSTKIYVDGEEIERWKVWPYSQYLR